jgi:hypothetical protein
MKQSFQHGGKPSYHVANKVYQAFGAGSDDLEGYNRDELRKSYNTIVGGAKHIGNILGKENITSSDFKKGREIISKTSAARQKSKTSFSNLTDLKEYQSIRGNYRLALDRYFFSRSVWNELTQGGNLNVFKKTYLSIIDDMIEKTDNLRKKKLGQFIEKRKSSDLTKREKKILSGKVKEDQFLEKPIKFERSPELKKLVRETENMVRREQRKIKGKMEKEDWDRLKKYRLVNDLISVKELKNPSELFKDKSEETEDDDE